jgi:hypothetical protein
MPRHPGRLAAGETFRQLESIPRQDRGMHRHEGQPVSTAGLDWRSKNHDDGVVTQIDWEEGMG